MMVVVVVDGPLGDKKHHHPTSPITTSLKTKVNGPLGDPKDNKDPYHQKDHHPSLNKLKTTTTINPKL